MSINNLPKASNYFDRSRGNNDLRMEVLQTIHPIEESPGNRLSEKEAEKIQKILQETKGNKTP